MGLTWDQVDGILQRAVARGPARRGLLDLTRIGVDETSFQKRRGYIAVVNDLVGGNLVWVADGQGREALDRCYKSHPRPALARIEAVAMGSWLDWASDSRLAPMVKVTQTIRFHLIGILSADVLGVTNARA